MCCYNFALVWFKTNSHIWRTSQITCPKKLQCSDGIVRQITTVPVLLSEPSHTGAWSTSHYKVTFPTVCVSTVIWAPERLMSPDGLESLKSPIFHVSKSLILCLKRAVLRTKCMDWDAPLHEARYYRYLGVHQVLCKSYNTIKRNSNSNVVRSYIIMCNQR